MNCAAIFRYMLWDTFVCGNYSLVQMILDVARADRCHDQSNVFMSTYCNVILLVLLEYLCFSASLAMLLIYNGFSVGGQWLWGPLFTSDCVGVSDIHYSLVTVGLLLRLTTDDSLYALSDGAWISQTKAFHHFGDSIEVVPQTSSSFTQSPCKIISRHHSFIPSLPAIIWISHFSSSVETQTCFSSL